MEKPIFNQETLTPSPSPSSTLQVISPGSSGRRSSASNSSEFEFWMVRNPSFPQPQLLSADELFVDGVLLPLHLLPHHSDPPDPEEQHKADTETPNPEPESEPGPGPESSAVLLPELTTGFSTSKRWRDIFKIGEKRTTARTSSQGGEDRDKAKKKERKSGGGGGGGGGGASGAELNINLWPFSRSRSSGNSVNRPKLAAAAATRKVSSAPCSRSNSAGESKSRRWPNSPGRVGVHLGRTSPVWQIRRGGSGVRSSNLTEPVGGVRNVDKEGASRSSEPVVKTADKGRKKETKETRRNKNNVGGGGGGGSRTRVLNLNVPMCIGYRQHLSCRSDENGTIGDGSGGGGGSDSQSSGATGNSGSGSSLLNLRTIFSKKVY
ncbi:uncharacterized protein LOC122093251 [Macadamia integrifolia]|uniref:uncharacterized protein LOC122093251 n=1 Tax=Macadamia integrifolia TaxID=60698 RepID=UPI001C531330|nr:uncharacterized protein LOC122093251 [Macadamia integrifolia]